MYRWRPMKWTTQKAAGTGAGAHFGAPARQMPSPKTVHISSYTKSQKARPVKIGSPQSALHFRKFQQPESPEPRAARGAQGALRKVSGLALPTRLRRAGPRACPPTFSSGTLLRTPRAALIHRGPNPWNRHHFGKPRFWFQYSDASFAKCATFFRSF